MGLTDAIQGRLASSGAIDRSLNYGRHLIARFLRLAGTNTPPRVVIDLGAGHGDDLALARAAYPDASLHAIESMEFHAAILEARGVRVHRLDIERQPLPFPDETADVVIANQILEHTKDLFWILHEATRVLRVGGSLMIGVPNLASLHNRVLLLLGRQPTSITINSAHVRGFTRRGLEHLLRAGAPGILRVERHAGSNFYPLPPGMARPLARLLPGMAVSSFFLIRKTAPYTREILGHVERSRFETNYYVGAPALCPNEPEPSTPDVMSR